jgi:DNA-binding response OmpR family regulator
VCLTRDLFFGVRIADTASRLGWRVITLGNQDDPVATIREFDPALVLVDLLATRDQWIALIRAARTAQRSPVTTVAFGSHMDLESRAVALEAGASHVLANSKLVTELPTLFARHAPSTPTSS